MRARWILELPADDGLVPVPVLRREGNGAVTQHFELRPPEEVQARCAASMRVHDRRRIEERWGGNQWGEQWVVDEWTRPLFARDQPLLATDLRLREWRAMVRAAKRERRR